jgi:ribosomal protein S18 acetylase RimI-like enzyme
MNITIRAKNANDEEFFYRVYASTRTYELSSVPWTPEQKEAFLRMQSNAQLKDYNLNHPHALFQVIERDGRPVGRLIIDNSGDTIHLMDIALLPEHRNQGIGTRLLQGLIEEGDRSNRPVRLHVETFNPAQDLYTRLGFVKTGELNFYLELTRQPRVQESNPHA